METHSIVGEPVVEQRHTHKAQPPTLKSLGFQDHVCVCVCPLCCGWSVNWCQDGVKTARFLLDWPVISCQESQRFALRNKLTSISQICLTRTLTHTNKQALILYMCTLPQVKAHTKQINRYSLQGRVTVYIQRDGRKMWEVCLQVQYRAVSPLCLCVSVSALFVLFTPSGAVSQFFLFFFF